MDKSQVNNCKHPERLTTEDETPEGSVCKNDLEREECDCTCSVCHHA